MLGVNFRRSGRELKIINDKPNTVEMNLEQTQEEFKRFLWIFSNNNN